MNLKLFYRWILLTFIFLCGLFGYLIYTNVSVKNYLSKSFQELSMVKIIKNTLPTPLEQAPSIENTKLLFGGDVSFDRYIRQVSDQYGYKYPLSQMSGFLNEYDAVIVNFESPITNNPSISMGSEFGSSRNYIFTSSPESLSVLKNSKISIFNLGNNHIGNFGEDGYKQTIGYLSDSGLNYFGYTQFSKENTYLIKDFGDITIGFVNFNQFINDGFNQALKDIGSVVNSVDVLILMAHWDNEYWDNPAEITRNRAREFIDAGVDIVIGSHPHVVQPVEEYKGKKIYYSLGNFVFDQYFDEKTKRGMLVEIEINDKKQIQTKEYFVEMKNNGTTILLN